MPDVSLEHLATCIEEEGREESDRKNRDDGKNRVSRDESCNVDPNARTAYQLQRFENLCRLATTERLQKLLDKKLLSMEQQILTLLEKEKSKQSRPAVDATGTTASGNKRQKTQTTPEVTNTTTPATSIL